MSQRNKIAPLAVAVVIISVLGFGLPISAQSKEMNEKKNLMDFAYANCMFWYFKSKKYDVRDIRAISGGYVEMGRSSADRYQEIAQYIKNYKTTRKTKQNIDPELLKCFYLDENEGLKKILNM